MSIENIQLYLKTCELTPAAYSEFKRLAKLRLKNSIYHMLFRITKDELAHDMVVNMLEKIHHFDPKRADIKSFCYLRYGNYLKNRCRGHFAKKRFAIFAEEPDREDESDRTIFDEYSITSSSEITSKSYADESFITAIMNYWDLNMDYHFKPKANVNFIARHIFKIIKGEEKADKTILDTALRLGVDKMQIYYALTVIREVNKRLYIKWLEEGEL